MEETFGDIDPDVELVEGHDRLSGLQVEGLRGYFDDVPEPVAINEVVDE